MCSRQPATISLSLRALARHGGQTGPHKDGWGVAFYQQRGVRVVKDTAPASASPWVRFLEAQPICSRLVVSHIRKATVGEPALENTQPFVRELGGRAHTFAHNGHVPRVREHGAFPLGLHRPLGVTDSEYAFCVLLARLERLWLKEDGAVPPLQARREVVSQFAAQLRPLGPANFLYSDGELLIAHGHRRHQDNGAIGAPGLYALIRECPGTQSLTADGLAVAPAAQHVALIASVPLTDEQWQPLREGEMLVIKDAAPVASGSVARATGGSQPALHPMHDVGGSDGACLTRDFPPSAK